MGKKIKQHLKKLEKEFNIKILLACETGSRAWGFPSPDSDYDIRMIYMHEPDWYLSINEQKDTIEMMLDNNNLDITGWDLRKTLGLLWKSNPALLERIQSPILYMHNEYFLTEINKLAQNCYSRIATMHHYLSMSKKCFEEIEGKPSYKLKRFFYALRTAAACRWILEKDAMPPIQFHELMDGLIIKENFKKRINELIDMKSKQDESYLHSGEEELFEFIRESLKMAEDNGKQLPAATGNINDLNVFLRRMLKQA